MLLGEEGIPNPDQQALGEEVQATQGEVSEVAAMESWLQEVRLRGRRGQVFGGLIYVEGDFLNTAEDLTILSKNSPSRMICKLVS